MSTRERPIELMSGNRNLSLGELTRMAHAIERITTMQGSSLIQGANGMTFKDQPITTIWAKITAKDASTPIKYTWQQVWPDGDGDWLEETSAPSGDDTSLPAYEANNTDLDVTSPFYTQLYIFNGSMLFFAGQGGTGGATITVKESDGTPTYASTTVIRVNQDDGFVLTQPSAGEVLISIQDASASVVGIVSTGTQSFAGNKTFTGTVTGSNSGVNAFYGSLAVAPAIMVGANYGGRFHHESDYGFTCELNSGDLGTAGNWTLETNSGGTELYFTLNDGHASISDVKYRLQVNGTTYTGATATTGGLSFRGGIYTGGTFSGGSGTVTSVGITAPAAGISVSGSPVTTSGNMTLALANDLAALEALSGTNTIYYRSGADTWSSVTIGAGLTFSGGTLSANDPDASTVTYTPANFNNWDGGVDPGDVDNALDQLAARIYALENP